MFNNHFVIAISARGSPSRNSTPKALVIPAQGGALGRKDEYNLTQCKDILKHRRGSEIARSSPEGTADPSFSPGCTHCYAETFAERFRGVPGHPFEQGFDLRLVPEKLADPLRWSKPKKIFVNSMSDLFHPEVPDDYIEKVCRVMLAANWHNYQVLPKRADRMAALLKSKLSAPASAAHIWWGVSVENRQHGLRRIATLRSAKPAVAFLSIEPLLEDIGKMDLRGIHWVIVGGESGPGARPMKAEWVRSIRSQCQEAGVPFFFKQWGGVRKSETGRSLDGKTYDEFPHRPKVRASRRTLVQATRPTGAVL